MARPANEPYTPELFGALTVTDGVFAGSERRSVVLRGVPFARGTPSQ